MAKPEWFEEIEHQVLVRNFLQNEYALQPQDTSFIPCCVFVSLFLSKVLV